jgi:hypothetical protein
MTVLDILIKAAAGMGAVKTVLEKAALAAPDLAPEIAILLAKLDAAVDPVNLAGIASEIPGELLNISQGKLDGLDHAGDAI